MRRRRFLAGVTAAAVLNSPRSSIAETSAAASVSERVNALLAALSAARGGSWSVTADEKDEYILVAKLKA
jgi:hypothetical protein